MCRTCFPTCRAIASILPGSCLCPHWDACSVGLHSMSAPIRLSHTWLRPSELQQWRCSDLPTRSNGGRGRRSGLHLDKVRGSSRDHNDRETSSSYKARVTACLAFTKGAIDTSTVSAIVSSISKLTVSWRQWSSCLAGRASLVSVFIEFPDTICYLREELFASVRLLPRWEGQGTT